jgi:hypothetical protein
MQFMSNVSKLKNPCAVFRILTKSACEFNKKRQDHKCHEFGRIARMNDDPLRTLRLCGLIPPFSPFTLFPVPLLPFDLIALALFFYTFLVASGRIS